ncbi:unnamed protein product [Paramecium octaurelia]|uniref:Uncharacterized protein n=1 Tax=Paramecium octaurelia TaxID=43137 RepID=A0A8S1X8F9_PAROT|nr:unnamed protein product [Paramecium octaurelia]
MSEKAMKVDPIILIQKIIRENTYLTEIDNKLDIDDFHNPLNVEETQSQLVDSIFGSCNIKSQKASKMISSSGNVKAPSIHPYGSLFKSGVSNYTVSDEDEIQNDFIEIKNGKQYNSEIEIDDVNQLKPPELKNQKNQITYEELNQRCQQLEQNLEVERKKNLELNDIILCQNEKIQELTEIEKAAYEQMDSRLKEISELSAKNIHLEAQLQELKERQEKELKTRIKGIMDSNNNSQMNAMLQIKEKQIQLLQGQLSSLRAATQYRSQGSYHSAQSHDNIQDNQVVNHIINNTNNNQIIIKNEIFQKGMTSLHQQPKTSTPKKQQFINQDSQSTQRSKKSVNHNKQSSKETITQPPTSWLDHLQKKNDDKLKILNNQPSEKEFQQAYLNNSINDNVNKYMHADLKITKVNSPAFQRKTTYQLTSDDDNQDNKDFVKQKSFQHK